MPRSVLLPLVWCLLFGGCATTEEAPAPVKDAPATPPTDLARRTVHLDGLDTRVERLARVGDIVANAFRTTVLRRVESDGRLDPVTRAWLDRMRAATATAFKADGLREDLVRSLAEHEEARAHLPTVAAWLDAPLHQQVADDRATVATPGGQAALGQAIARIPSDPPDPQRLTLVRTLHEASGRVDIFLALSFDASSDLMRALEPLLPETLAGDERSPEQHSADRDGFRARVQRTLLLQDWFALQARSDRELEQLRSFWMSPAGRWYARERLWALRAATSARAKQVADALSAESGVP